MFIAALIIVIIDQLTKKWAIQALKNQGSKVIIKNFFELTYVENRGAAFGVLSDRRIFFIIITTVVVVVLVGYIFKNHKIMSSLEKISMSLILAGALGNFIDRLLNGYVVDLFSLRFGNYYFPVFNVADIAIVLGTLLLVYIIVIAKDLH